MGNRCQPDLRLTSDTYSSSATTEISQETLLPEAATRSSPSSALYSGPLRLFIASG